MISEQQLKEVIVSQKKIFLAKKDLFQRRIMDEVYEKYLKLKEILVITGVRRCGKSSLMKLVWNQIKLKKKLKDGQFLYINFEDERLSQFSVEDFSKLLEAYLELYSPDKKQKIFLFLDEIQNIPKWEKWLNRLYEEDKYKIIITGSNATLLSSELATALTGRHIPIILYPLSFYEYWVYFKKNPLDKKSFYNMEERIEIKKAFTEYITLGGMPEYLKTKEPELIQEYFKNILFRDIVNRYNIKHKKALQELAHIVLSNLGQIQSLRNLGKATYIDNISTIKNYVQYLENSFLFYSVPRFSFSYKQQIYNPDKMYLVDVAFFYCVAFKTGENIGAIYENIVFLQLLRQKGNEVFYYNTKHRHEVDFVVKKQKTLNLIQVSFNLESQKTIEREERALIEAMAELDVSEGIILNRDVEKQKVIDGKKIIYIPLWKWLLTIQ